MNARQRRVDRRRRERLPVYVCRRSDLPTFTCDADIDAAFGPGDWHSIHEPAKWYLKIPKSTPVVVLAARPFTREAVDESVRIALASPYAIPGYGR